MISRTVTDQRTGRTHECECEAMTALVEITEALDDQRTGKEIHVESNIERTDGFGGKWSYTTEVTNRRFIVAYRFEE